MSNSGQLFEADDSVRPLADRLRPRSLPEFFGQSHLLGEDSTLRQVARMIANHCDAHFMSISAVLAGVKDIREKVSEARDRLNAHGQRSVLFVDEVHRFNKSQQDAFLPHIEDGTLYFVGATTENPSFELNNALLSRVRVYVLKHLETTDIRKIIDGALLDTDRGLGDQNIDMADSYRDMLAATADGDARHALVLLELAADCARLDGDRKVIDERVIKEVTRDSFRQFDKGGDHFYDQISALHKSMRGSDPDAALYWFCRMIDGGCDPLYIARRVLRFASEDIGNADPRAAQHALYAWDAYSRLGSPEGELAIAHAIIFMSCAPKSNAVYNAYKSAMAFVKDSGNQPVPMSLRNAPTTLMKELGHGDGYRYAHDEVDGFAAGAHYFPDTLDAVNFYEPVERGLEIRIRERLLQLRQQNEQAKKR